MQLRKVIFALTTIAVVAAVLSFSAFDDELIQQATKQLDKWSANYPVEKVYLQTDKPYYAAGDDVWFKGYITLGPGHRLSGLSGVLNVELINPQDSVIRHVKLPVSAGLAWGDFSLADTLRAGNYRIRAYTNYMLNAGDAYFFDKQIAVVNLISNKSLTNTSFTYSAQNGRQKADAVLSADIDVQFFPEGGSLVNGVTSKIAFKAVAATGLGADVKGTVTDDKNNIVATFQSQHLGMGTFRMTPLKGVTYKATINYEDNLSKIFDLPAAVDKGYVLSILTGDPGKININLIAGRQMLLMPDTVSLIAQEGGKVYYAAKSAGGSRAFSTTVLSSRFPSGIVQFTLFSSKGEPLNERLVFIQNPDQLKLSVSGEKTIYGPEQMVKLNINAQTSDGKPDVGSFSIAVTDETIVPSDENTESSILADLLLTSDLRGFIEQPNYYFNDTDERTKADLDNLMLTQGYRRFEWKDILNDKFPPLVYQPEKSLRITGHVTSPGGKPVAKCRVTLFSNQGTLFLLDTVSDQQGKFEFKNLAFNDSLRFIIQGHPAKGGNNLKINIDNISQSPITVDKNGSKRHLNINSTLANYINNNKNLYDMRLKYGLIKTTELKEVVIRDVRPEITHSFNRNGPGNADQVLTGKQIPMGFSTIQDALNGRLVGVSVFNGHFSTPLGFMTVNLDGNNIPDSDIGSVNPYDIESVEVLRTVASYSIYGSLAGAGGIIIITSKSAGDYNNNDLSRPALGTVSYSPIGYYKARKFYSPQYSDPKTNKAVADLRSTIYWQPNLVTDEKGNASVEFYNGGTKGTYRIVIEGMNINGNIGRQVYRYSVE